MNFLTKRSQNIFYILITLFSLAAFKAVAQIDPERRNLVEMGYDQPLHGQGPQGVYAYYYYNNPTFSGSNVVLRVAVAPVYLDSELGFKQVLFPYTDVGVGISGGLYGDEFYEVRQGNYLKDQSFDGDNAGASVSIYQLFDPGVLIPVSAVVRGGFHYSTYDGTDNTGKGFVVPDDQTTPYTRVGLRVAGKEPVLDPALGLELSVWYERQWRMDSQNYGYAGDRTINPAAGLYWVYADLNYTWTNSGQKISFAVTAGGSQDADRFSAWRLGGVLPLISEFPLVIPGYYYEELSARSFVHMYGSYDVPLDKAHRFKFRLEAASAHIDYLTGFQQKAWQTGAGCALTFAPKKKNFEIVLRYGYGFNALRHGNEGAQSVGVLFQYDFEARKKSSENE